MSGGSLRLAVKARAWSPTQAQWVLAAQCVQPEEKERISRFVFKKDSKSAMVGRLLIRRAVSSILGIPYNSVSLARTDKGKPYLLSPSDGAGVMENVHTGCCQFNISHQGDFVVLAADRTRRVGVDIMKVEWPRKTSIQDFFRLMERQLTQQEWSQVWSRDNDMDQLQVFYRYWCLKESVLKAEGLGLGRELSSIDFHLDPRDLDLCEGQVTTSTSLTMDGQPQPQWTFEESLLDSQHCVAVALETTSPSQDGSGDWSEGKAVGPEPFTVWSVEELLSGCLPLPGSTPDIAYWQNFDAKDEAPKLS